MEIAQRDAVVREILDRETTAQILIDLHEEGWRLYKDLSDLNGWDYRLRAWEERVEQMIRERLSVAEMHAFRNRYTPGFMRDLPDAPEEWRERVKRDLVARISGRAQ